MNLIGLFQTPYETTTNQDQFVLLGIPMLIIVGIMIIVAFTTIIILLWHFLTKHRSTSKATRIFSSYPQSYTQKSILEKNESYESCPHCGAFVTIESSFCDSCGESLV